VLVLLVLLSFRAALARLDRILLGHDMSQSYNWEAFNRWALSQGQLPLWNPFMFSGFPALADLQTELFYPPAIALRWLPIPAYFTFLTAFHMVVAGTSTYGLCRHLGVSRTASFVGATGLMLGGVFAPKIDAGFVTVIGAWAWFPLGIWLAILTARSSGRLPPVALAGVLACQILAGHPQSTLYSFGATSLYFVVAAALVWREAGSRPALAVLIRGALAFVLALGLSAIQVLPTSVLLAGLSRGEGLTFDEAARNSLSLPHVLTLLFPHAFESLPPDPIEDYRSKYWEEAAYVGLVVTLLAPLGLLYRRDRAVIWFLVLLAGIGLAFGAGKNLPIFGLHYLLLPGLRHASRLMPLWSLAVAVLGAIGLDMLVRGQVRRSWAIGYVASAAGLTLALATLPLLHAGSFPPGEAHGRSIAFVVAPLALMLVLAVIGTTARLGRLVLGALVVSVAVDLVAYASGFVQVVLPVDRRSDTANVLRLLEGVEVGRAVSLCDNVLSPNDMTSLRIPTVDGYNSFFFGDYGRYGLLASSGLAGSLPKHAPRLWTRDKPPSRPDLLRLLNVTHLIGCSAPPPSGYAVVRDRQRTYLLENQAPLDRAIWMCQARVVGSEEEAIRALSSSDLDTAATVVVQGTGVELPDDMSCGAPATIAITSRDRPDGSLRARISANGSGVLFLSEPAYSERRAFLDGREVISARANLAFTAVAIGPGEHELELRFVPTSLYVGAAVSLLSIIVAMCAIALPRRHDRSTVTAADALRSS
jgi:hypothetical protein